MQKSEVQTDNPQERPCCSLSWLCGIIDADGCFNFDIINTKKEKRIKPRIFVLTNTDYSLIKEVVNIMNKYGFAHYVSRRKSANENHSTRYDVIVVGYKRCKRILPYLIPHLRGKSDQAVLMLELVNQRIADVAKYGHSRVGGYTDEQMQLIGCVKQLNERGPSSLKHGILRD